MPGSTVAVEGFAGEFDGLWLVRGMEMKTNRGHFLTEWDLSRDDKGLTTSTSYILSTYQSPPHPMLHSGVWRASVRRAHAYSSN